MYLPNFIAIEAFTYEETSFPLNLAWSLDDGSFKQALILPDEAWQTALEQESELGLNSDIFQLEAFSPEEILKEFLYDQTQDTFYIANLYPEEAWLEKFFTAAVEEQNFSLELASSLIKDAELWEMTYQDKLDYLALDSTKAEDQIQALLATYVELSSN